MKKNHITPAALSLWVFAMILLTIIPMQASAERIFLAGYKGGFYIRSEEEGGMEMRLGGSFQADYRAYAETDRADSRFDIRKARLLFQGQVTPWFRYDLEYEFQGNATDNLVDAYGEFVFSEMQALRVGQFKEPFSLEWQGADKAQWFAERSMGYYLSPLRDVGMMLNGSMAQGSVNYALGLFNGDGQDGSARGNDHATPEITGRVAVKPFGATDMGSLRSLQVGASASYAKIDPINVGVGVKSTGMAGLTRNLYVLSVNSNKFGVLQDVNSRIRGNVEAAWVKGPFALTGEYTHLRYTDIDTSEIEPTDADFSSWYASMAWCVTGEDFSLAGGVVNPIYPRQFFNPDEGTYGALCLAARYEHFTGDKEWIVKDANVSVRNADAASVCATWILFPMLRVVADYTYTDLSDPIKVRVNQNGSIDYINRENVLTLRLSMDI
ncbi:MAG: porin [Syntrophaceae bacterium]|nr:OprO/OprP family phosphate-selective porin [Deltaproteobacteria bacterium]